MTDKQIIRELAKQYMELALSEQQQRSNQRMKDTNDLKLVRPPVLIDEIPWGELEKDESLVCLCQDPGARGVETHLRRTIYKKKHFKADVLMQPYWRVPMSWSMSPSGLEKERVRLETMSHTLVDTLENEEALDVVKPPVCERFPEYDEKNMNYFTDLLGDTMEVRLTGSGEYFGFWAWDDISFLRGVEPIYEDMYERPEYLHRIMGIFAERAKAQMDFLEQNNMVPNDPVNLHCTPGMVSGMKEEGWKSTWYRGMAQCFSCVSPAMFKEFELDYIKEMAERCAYTYYGCCEPLDDRIDMLKTIKNLRKLGVSPWANIESCAEQIGRDFVYARKPNPALVAHKTDPEEVRKETERTVKACLKNGCPTEFVLKDISTVSGNPENLVVWADTVSRVLDEYYEEA